MIGIIDKIGVDMFLGSQSAFLDHFALVLTNAWVWVPMFLTIIVMIIKNNDNMQQIFLCLLCVGLCLFIASGTAALIVKPLTERLRPANDPMIKYLVPLAGDMHPKDYSFFSAHAANTMAVATFFMLVTRSALMSLTLYLWSFINMWTRLYLGQHFLTDILVGMVWGIISGVITYLIFARFQRNISAGQKFISSQYTSTGYSYLDVDMVVSVFFIIIIIATIPVEWTVFL